MRLLLALACTLVGQYGWTYELPPAVALAEQHRVETVAAITPATIAIFDKAGEGGGSGVIIRDDGLALTNFHVTAPCGSFMLCGLADGSVEEAVLLGLDPTGDLALIKLLSERKYPVAKIGDSRLAYVGQEVLVAGNPLLLSDNLQPSISFGLLSGVGRYQYPAGTILEYGNCLQTDAAINPGNSGGPLYNLQAELIGINGRASFEKRGRVNVGVGYAISINQAMRFVPLLESGRIVDHAKIGFTVRTLSGGKVVIDQIESTSDAYRRGLRYGDQVEQVAGDLITSANQLMNLLATYPPAWRLPVTIRRAGRTHTAWVRLAPSHVMGELAEAIKAQSPPHQENAEQRRDLFQTRPGFANFAANPPLVTRVLEHCPQWKASTTPEPWRIVGQSPRHGRVEIWLGDQRASCDSKLGEYWIRPDHPLDGQLDPPGSRGMLSALCLWKRLMQRGPDAFGQLVYWGQRPWGARQQMSECLVASQGSVQAEFFFAMKSGELLGVEFIADPSEDACLVEMKYAEGSALQPVELTITRSGEPWLQVKELTFDSSAKGAP